MHTLALPEVRMMDLSHLPETLIYLYHFTERLGVKRVAFLHRVRVRKQRIACSVVMSKIIYFSHV